MSTTLLLRVRLWIAWLRMWCAWRRLPAEIRKTHKLGEHIR